MDVQARVEDIIRGFESQGSHRTGTVGDLASAEWMAELVRQAGAEPELHAVDLDRLEVMDCYVEVDGDRIEAVPLFDCTYTAPRGLEGPLAAEAGPGEVALFATPPTGPQESLVALRRTTPAAAVVVITEGRAPGLALLNAPAFTSPFGPPVVQVSSEDGPRLRAAAEAGSTMRVVAHAERRTARAYNVTASVGSGDRYVLGVNTPRSGWWECAGERGGGLVCWLEVLRAVVEAKPSGRVFFSATTGHEIGHLGFDRLLSERAELAGIPTWMHFGANIGCASATTATVHVSDQEIAALALEAAGRHGAREPRVALQTGGGEMKTAREHGATRWIALTNDNAHFHMTSDRYDTNVDAAAVAAFARGFVDVARRVLGPTGR